MFETPSSFISIVTMGRFRVITDNGGYDGDHDDHSPQDINNPHPHWEFTAEKGEEGAIVVRRKRRRLSSSHDNDQIQESSDYQSEDDYQEDEIESRQGEISTGRRIYFWERSINTHDDDDDDDGYDASMISPRPRHRHRSFSCFKS